MIFGLSNYRFTHDYRFTHLYLCLSTFGGRQGMGFSVEWAGSQSIDTWLKREAEGFSRMVGPSQEWHHSETGLDE